ncbi:MAG TPA: hypothetical protein VGL24_08825 [Chthoniobacterales bacterium]
MNSLRNSTAGGPKAGRRTQTTLMLGTLLLLAAVFWTVSMPELLAARETTAAELIAAQLPEKKTLKNATQIEFLSAVCAAVRRRRSSAPVFAQAAVLARRELAAESVGMILRCIGKANCEVTGAVVAAATAAEGDVAKITDAAMAKAPDCAETIRAATQRKEKTAERPEASLAPEPSAMIGTSNGPDEGFDPHEPLNLVCDHGTPRAVRTSLLEEFLRTNPGAVLGPCETSPSTNR